MRIAIVIAGQDKVGARNAITATASVTLFRLPLGVGFWFPPSAIRQVGFFILAALIRRFGQSYARWGFLFSAAF